MVEGGKGEGIKTMNKERKKKKETLKQIKWRDNSSGILERAKEKYKKWSKRKRER